MGALGDDHVAAMPENTAEQKLEACLRGAWIADILSAAAVIRAVINDGMMHLTHSHAPIR